MSTATLAAAGDTAPTLLQSSRQLGKGHRMFGIECAASLRLARPHTPVEMAAQVALVAKMAGVGPDQHEAIDSQINDLVARSEARGWPPHTVTA